MTEMLRENIRAACARANVLRAKDSLIFPVFSDLHTDGVTHVHAQILIEMLRVIDRELACDLCVNLGDNFSMLGRSRHITDKQLQQVGEELFSAIAQSIRSPMLYVNGNHDAHGTDFYTPDFWNALVKGRFGNVGTGYDEVGSYCYFDHEKSKTRLIVLSCPCDSHLDGDDPAPVWALGQKQIDWLRVEALHTPYTVLLLMHVPPFYRYCGDMEERLAVFTGTHEATATIANLSGWIEDRDALASVLKDFIASGGRLIACLSGHTHTDSLWLPFEKRDGECNALPCPQCVIGGVCVPGRTHETYGASLDIALWTPSEQRLSLIRIGDGEDRVIPILH